MRIWFSPAPVCIVFHWHACSIHLSRKKDTSANLTPHVSQTWTVVFLTNRLSTSTRKTQVRHKGAQVAPLARQKLAKQKPLNTKAVVSGIFIPCTKSKEYTISAQNNHSLETFGTRYNKAKNAWTFLLPTRLEQGSFSTSLIWYTYSQLVSRNETGQSSAKPKFLTRAKSFIACCSATTDHRKEHHAHGRAFWGGTHHVCRGQGWQYMYNNAQRGIQRNVPAGCAWLLSIDAWNLQTNVSFELQTKMQHGREIASKPNLPGSLHLAQPNVPSKVQLTTCSKQITKIDLLWHIESRFHNVHGSTTGELTPESPCVASVCLGTGECLPRRRDGYSSLMHLYLQQRSCTEAKIWGKLHGSSRQVNLSKEEPRKATTFISKATTHFNKTYRLHFAPRRRILSTTRSVCTRRKPYPFWFSVRAVNRFKPQPQVNCKDTETWTWQ